MESSSNLSPELPHFGLDSSPQLLLSPYQHSELSKHESWEGSPYEFLQLDPKEQVKLLEPAEWQQMDIPQGEVPVDFHPHPIKPHQKGEVNGWDCDARPHFGLCFSGLTGFYQSQGLQGWSCRKCNFDVCKKCLQVQLVIQRIQERED